MLSAEIPNIKKIREKLGRSQLNLSSKFGHELRMLQDWESGRRSPTRLSVTLLKVIVQNSDKLLKLFKLRGKD